MRTKALLLGAAISAVSLATSMAAVYSVNIVGYVNTPIPNGWSIICNPLNCSGGNAIRNVMPAPPVYPEGRGLSVFAYVNSTGLYRSALFTWYVDPEDPGPAVPLWQGGDLDASPGKGLFVNNQGTNFTWTFVGEVPTGDNLTNQISPGYNLVSSVVPKTGKVQTELGYAPSLGANGTVDFVLKYVNSTGLYQSWQWIGYEIIDEEDPSIITPPHWAPPGEPTVNVGEGIWIWRGGATGTTWTQSFNVGS